MSLFFIDGKCLKSSNYQPLFFSINGNKDKFSLSISSQNLEKGKKHYLLLKDHPVLSPDEVTFFSLDGEDTRYTLESKSGAFPIYEYRPPSVITTALFALLVILFFIALIFFLYKRHG